MADFSGFIPSIDTYNYALRLQEVKDLYNSERKVLPCRGRRCAEGAMRSHCGQTGEAETLRVSATEAEGIRLCASAPRAGRPVSMRGAMERTAFGFAEACDSTTETVGTPSASDGSNTATGLISLIQELIKAAEPFLSGDNVVETTGTIPLMNRLEHAIRIVKEEIANGRLY